MPKHIVATLAVVFTALCVSPAGAAGMLPDVQSRFQDYVDRDASSAEISQALDMLNTIARRIRDDYVDMVGMAHIESSALSGMQQISPHFGATDPDALFAAAADGMLTSLDPHSNYISPEQWRDFQVQERGEFGGLGLKVTLVDNGVQVVTPLDGTPAFHAGMRAADLITHIDGVSVIGLSLRQAVAKMRGKVGTTIRLAGLRGASSFELIITRAMISIESVRWRRAGNVGYIRISAFMADTADKVEAALQAMRDPSGGYVEGLVIDLRNNPGGLLSSAVAVADHFIAKGTITTVRGRNEGGQTYTATTPDRSAGLPLVVLINKGTASGAELLAAALRSSRRAVMIGGQSFGKGSVQTLMPLDNGGATRMTTARYYSELGTTFDGNGLPPDIIVAETPDSADDAPYQRAVAVLSKPAVTPTGHVNPMVSPSAVRLFAKRSDIKGFIQGPPRPYDIAVIIGNADYSKLTRDLPDVKPAYADAEGIKRYVKRTLGIREGNIIDLRDATGGQMDRVFGTETTHKGQLYDWVRPRSNVFIYYAGHGAPAGGEGTAYLVPSDADPTRIELNGYPLDRLYRNLGKISARSITVVLEACFSGVAEGGSVVSMASPIFVKPKSPAVPDNITVIAAGASDQMASWETDASHGLFTKYFLKAMTGEADDKPFGNGDKKVSSKELNAYLKDTLTYFARRYYGRDQTAVIKVGKHD